VTVAHDGRQSSRSGDQGRRLLGGSERRKGFECGSQRRDAMLQHRNVLGGTREAGVQTLGQSLSVETSVLPSNLKEAVHVEIRSV